MAVGGNRGGVLTLNGEEVRAFSLNGTVDEMAAPPPIATKVSLGGAPVDSDFLPRIAQVPADMTLGQSADVTLSTPGTCIYNCTPHPWMVGEIIVK